MDRFVLRAPKDKSSKGETIHPNEEKSSGPLLWVQRRLQCDRCSIRSQTRHLGEPNVSPSSVEPSDDLYQRGMAFYRAGNFQRARENALQALAAQPHNVPALVLLGMSLLEMDEADEAIEPLEHATQLAPDNADGWRNLAVALMTAGELNEAVEAFRALLRLHPNNIPVMVDLANVLFMLGRAQEALDTLEEAHRLQPGDLAILRNLADMYASASRSDRALATTQEILELLPDDTVANLDAAWLFLQLDRLDEAASVWQRLRHLGGDDEHELYALHGLIMTEIKRRNWRRALDLAIQATRLDRYEFTTTLLSFISGRLFGKTGGEVSEKELAARFEAEHRDHRRLYAEA
jgi:tetratricopeptide (TPR) repeat protein